MDIAKLRIGKQESSATPPMPPIAEAESFTPPAPVHSGTKVLTEEERRAKAKEMWAGAFKKK